MEAKKKATEREKDILEKIKEYRKQNIKPEILVGEKEFMIAYKKSPYIQAEWRSMGMPHCTDGKVFMYFTDEVNAWIKNNFRIQLPEIRMTNLRAV